MARGAGDRRVWRRGGLVRRAKLMLFRCRFASLHRRPDSSLTNPESHSASEIKHIRRGAYALACTNPETTASNHRIRPNPTHHAYPDIHNPGNHHPNHRIQPQPTNHACHNIRNRPHHPTQRPQPATTDIPRIPRHTRPQKPPPKTTEPNQIQHPAHTQTCANPETTVQGDSYRRHLATCPAPDGRPSIHKLATLSKLPA